MNSPKSQGTALVTGASSGIGAVYAERLAARGFDLLLVARDQERLESAASKLRDAHGVKVEVLKADLTQKDEVLKLEQRLRSDSGISLLVNNAGVAVNGLLANADPEVLEQLIQLNVTTLPAWLPQRQPRSPAPGAARSSISRQWPPCSPSASMPPTVPARPMC
ncbi:hypothetical protein EMIT0P265_130144 [Pseudomonas zeae]